MGKFLKPCVGLGVGKLVWSVSSYSEIVNRVLSPESLFGSQKSGRFGVRLIVAMLSFTLAYNVLGIAEGGDFYHKSLIEERKLNLAQIPNRSRSAPLLAIPC